MSMKGLMPLWLTAILGFIFFVMGAYLAIVFFVNPVVFWTGVILLLIGIIMIFITMVLK